MAKLTAALDGLEANLRLEEFEACPFFGREGRSWWLPAVRKSIQDIGQERIHNTQLENFANPLKIDSMLLSWPSTAGAGKDSPQICFERHLRQSVNLLARDYDSLDEETELKRLASLHSYDKAYARALERIQTSLNIRHQDIQEKTQQRVQHCLTKTILTWKNIFFPPTRDHKKFDSSPGSSTVLTVTTSQC